MTAAVLASAEAQAGAAPAGGLDDTLNFLQRTLPPEQPGANYFVSEQDAGGRWRDHHVATIAEAARLALQIDAAGANAYFALAAFAPDSSAPSRVRRRQEHAVSLRALFLDVDCGKPGAYATQEEARTELKRFCNAAGLPLPRSISSGKGLHLHWVLNEPVPRGEWQGAADTLAALCSALAFKADPACTTDAARVLRPVGTHWRKKEKGGPLPVRLLEDAPSTPFATIKAIFDEACRRHGAVVKERAPAPVKSPRKSINWEFEVRHIYPAANADLIADNCAQLREMRDTGGRITEPRWHACIGVLAFADNGDEVAHKWSSGDPRYTHAETERKIERAREFKPTTCARFAELCSEPCASCTYKGKIKSPIQLGNLHRIALKVLQLGESPPAAPVAPQSPVTGNAPASAPRITPDVMQRAAIAFGASTAVEPLFDIESARASRFFRTVPPPRTWILKDCLPAGIVGGIVASGGTGKSQAMLQLAAAVATGLPFCDTWEVCEPGEVLALMAEDDDAELHRRMQYIARQLEHAHPGRNIERTIGQNCVIKSLVGAGNNLLTKLYLDREVRQTDLVARVIATACQLSNLKLIILDPASRFRGGVENSAEDVTRFIEALECIRAAFRSVTVLIVHHTNKWSSQSDEQSAGAARGSSAFSDGLRFQLNLAALNQKEAARVPADERHLYLSATVTKNSYAPPRPTVYLKRTDGGVLTKASLEDPAGKKGGNIILQIVARVRDNEPMSANTFETEFGGTTNVFGIGKVSLRGYIKQAIDTGYLTKAETGREKPLIVTDSGRAALSIMDAAAAKSPR